MWAGLFSEPECFCGEGPKKPGEPCCGSGAVYGDSAGQFDLSPLRSTLYLRMLVNNVKKYAAQMYEVRPDTIKVWTKSTPDESEFQSAVILKRGNYRCDEYVFVQPARFESEEASLEELARELLPRYSGKGGKAALSREAVSANMQAFKRLVKRKEALRIDPQAFKKFCLEKKRRRDAGGAGDAEAVGEGGHPSVVKEEHQGGEKKRKRDTGDAGDAEAVGKRGHLSVVKEEH